MLTALARLELEEEVLALELTLKRCEVARVKTQDELVRIDRNEAAAQAAIAERRAKLAALVKERVDG